MKNFSTLHFHITSRCSYRCRHCSADAGPDQSDGDLQLEDIERMLDQAQALGAEDFDISGGDPLALEERFILETIKCSSEKGLSTSLCTNAQNLSAKYMDDLFDAGLQKIKLSLYGAAPATHDDFTRVPGSFEKVIDGIKLSKQAGMEVWINAVVTPLNVEEFRRLSSLLRPLDVDLVQLTSIVPCGRGETAHDFKFSEDGLGRAIGVLKEHLVGLDYAFTITLFPDPDTPAFIGRYCDYFDDRLVVNPNGDIIPCCLLPASLQHRLGNVREDLPEVCSDHRIRQDIVFQWLARGHQAMRKELGYERVSHNLCSICIDMLYRLSGADRGGSSFAA